MVSRREVGLSIVERLPTRPALGWRAGRAVSGGPRGCGASEAERYPLSSSSTLLDSTRLESTRLDSTRSFVLASETRALLMATSSEPVTTVPHERASNNDNERDPRFGAGARVSVSVREDHQQRAGAGAERRSRTCTRALLHTAAAADVRSPTITSILTANCTPI